MKGQCNSHAIVVRKPYPHTPPSQLHPPWHTTTRPPAAIGKKTNVKKTGVWWLLGGYHSDQSPPRQDNRSGWRSISSFALSPVVAGPSLSMTSSTVKAKPILSDDEEQQPMLLARAAQSDNEFTQHMEGVALIVDRPGSSVAVLFAQLRRLDRTSHQGGATALPRNSGIQIGRRVKEEPHPHRVTS